MISYLMLSKKSYLNTLIRDSFDYTIYTDWVNYLTGVCILYFGSRVVYMEQRHVKVDDLVYSNFQQQKKKP